MQLIQTQQYTLAVPGLLCTESLRLAFLSDLHNNIYPSLLQQIKEAAPDAVLVGGDMVNRPTLFGTPPRFTRGYGCLRRLAALGIPVFYAPGNHESRWKANEKYEMAYGAYRAALQKKGVVFLENDSVLLHRGSVTIRLYGLEMDRMQYSHHPKKRRPPSVADISERLGEAPKDGWTILMPHHPDYIREYAAWGADLVLAGHLHGGQARLPGIGGLIAPGFQFFPPYTKGLYETEKPGETGRKTRMIVSAGLGTHTIPFRLFNPRELLIIDLVGK